MPALPGGGASGADRGDQGREDGRKRHPEADRSTLQGHAEKGGSEPMIDKPVDRGGRPLHRSELMKGATPEEVAWASLRPVHRKPPKEAKQRGPESIVQTVPIPTPPRRLGNGPRPTPPGASL